LRFALFLLGLLLAFGAPAREPTARAGSGLVDLDGRPWDVLSSPAPGTKFVAFIFTRTDCPISNAYAPEIRALHADFAARGVEYWLVFGTNESPEVIRKHLAEFRYPCGALRDPHHAFAKQSRVRVTPEAAVYRREGGELLFHGRIDDRYAELEVRRPAPTVRDLHAALEDLLAGKPAKVPSAPAVGCIIEGGE
jgi:AhpC/TSA family